MNALLIGLGIVGLWTASAAFAAEGVVEKAMEKTGLSKGTPTLSSADQAFVHKAAEGGMAEVEMAKLAEKKAKSEEVKKFASKMIEDHTKTNEKLKTLADEKDAKLPSDLGPDQKKTMAELEKLEGAAFDAKYMAAQVEAHAKMHETMEKQAKAASDPDLKKFAAETVGVVHEHHKLAEQISGAAKGEAGAAH